MHHSQVLQRCLVPAVWIVLLALPQALFAHGVIRYDKGLWWNGEKFEARTVFTKEGVFQDSVAGEPDTTINLEGGFVVPPLADAHNHGLGGPGFEQQVNSFLAKGIFYTANPNNILKLTKDVRPYVNKTGSVAVTYSNASITGPGGHPIQIYDRMAGQIPGWSKEDMNGQAYFVIDSEADLERVWPIVLAGEPDFLKVMLEYSEEHEMRAGNSEYFGKRGLDPRWLPAVIERAHRAGLRVVVHVSSAADVDVAVKAGADAIAHLPLERIAEATAREAAERGVVFMTTLVSHRPSSHVENLDEVHRHNLSLLSRFDVPMVLGTDGERGLLGEIAELARLSTMSTARVLDLATRATPQWIFPKRVIGTLKSGAEASFLVLDQDPLKDLAALSSIRLRVQNGHELEVEPQAETKPSIGQHIVSPLMHEGVDAAIALYRKLRRERPEDFDFTESQLNALGYELLKHDLSGEAVEIFKLNAEMFPTSANAHDSWGEGLMEAGRVAEAISQYERSLEMQPHNEGAVEKLKQLRALKPEE